MMSSQGMVHTGCQISQCVKERTIQIEDYRFKHKSFVYNIPLQAEILPTDK